MPCSYSLCFLGGCWQPFSLCWPLSPLISQQTIIKYLVGNVLIVRIRFFGWKNTDGIPNLKTTLNSYYQEKWSSLVQFNLMPLSPLSASPLADRTSQGLLLTQVVSFCKSGCLPSSILDCRKTFNHFCLTKLIMSYDSTQYKTATEVCAFVVTLKLHNS